MIVDDLSFSKIFRTNSLVLEQRNTSTLIMQTDCDTTLKYYPPNTPEAYFTVKPAINKIHAKYYLHSMIAPKV